MMCTVFSRPCLRGVRHRDDDARGRTCLRPPCTGGTGRAKSSSHVRQILTPSTHMNTWTRLNAPPATRSQDLAEQTYPSSCRRSREENAIGRDKFLNESSGTGCCRDSETTPRNLNFGLKLHKPQNSSFIEADSFGTLVVQYREDAFLRFSGASGGTWRMGESRIVDHDVRPGFRRSCICGCKRPSEALFYSSKQRGSANSAVHVTKRSQRRTTKTRHRST